MIRCPDCGGTTIYVVAVALVANGERLTDLNARLAADGFAFAAPPGLRDCSTTDELAECAACGAAGDLWRFGFGVADAAAAPVTLQLTLTVTYRPNGEPLGELGAGLTGLVRYGLNRGLLTGDSDAEVTAWTAEVAQVTPAGLRALD